MLENRDLGLLLEEGSLPLKWVSLKRYRGVFAQPFLFFFMNGLVAAAVLAKCMVNLCKPLSVRVLPLKLGKPCFDETKAVG